MPLYFSYIFDTLNTKIVIVICFLLIRFHLFPELELTDFAISNVELKIIKFFKTDLKLQTFKRSLQFRK